MKKFIGILILFVCINTMVFSQFVLEPPIIEFDVDFGSDSFGILRYYGYRPLELDFWIETASGSIFQNLIDSSETLILSSFSAIEDNIALDNFIKSTMRRNNIPVCITFLPNDFGGFTYIVNFSFDNFTTYGFISMDSKRYVSPSNKSEVFPLIIDVPSLYTIITGRTVSISITEDELSKRINLQNSNDIISWLRMGSIDIIESSGVQFDRLINVLENNFKNDYNSARNTVRNIGNNVMYHWLADSNGRIIEWIVYFMEK